MDARGEERERRTRRGRRRAADAAPAPAWHSLRAAEVVAALASDLRVGLSSGEVAARRTRHGRNIIAPRRERPAIVRLLLAFDNGLIYVLLGATAITAALGAWIDSGVILGVVLVNAIVGFVQESKAVRAIAALARTMTTEATVLRDGERRRVAAEDLVPGDVVVLAGGDKVPADLRLLEAHDLHMDESALTGESAAVSKRVEAVPAEAGPADRRDMAYASSLVTRGRGAGVVIATGDRTEVGRIGGLIAEAAPLATPLARKTAQFSRLLMWVILGVAIGMFAVGLARGMPLIETFMAAVALAVGAIPEGLPAAMTVTLAIGVGRMASRNAVIRKLPAVEGLGSTTVICSDKTGTLTENQMTVVAVVAGGEPFEVTGAGYEPSGEVRAGAGGDAAHPAARPGLEECLRAGALCNDAVLLHAGARWVVQGDPTEGALLVSARKAGLVPEELAARFPRLDVIPFESESQFMATMHPGEKERPIVYVKGSVERVLSMCTSAADARGRPAPLDPDAVHAQADAMTRRALRVLAFACLDAPAACDDLTHDMLRGGLRFLGLQGMLDPPRPEAIEAVATCRRAGVAVKMITGDHAGTARAIAEMIGLGPGMSAAAAPDGAEPRALAVVTGADMASVLEAQLPGLAESTHVFARMTPEQKIRLVKALQSRGHVVAMTGDGVNDAPALRQADIGVAMGLSGTEVAKEAADVVLADDNFSSIKAAVEEGRTVFDNLTKFIVWTMPTNAGEALIILAAVLTGQQLPILPVQALYVNLTTAILLGLMLAFEPKEADVMSRGPRDPAQPILTFELLMRSGLMSILLLLGGYGLFEWAQWRGSSDEQARTIVVSVIVAGEAVYLFNCRSLVRSIWSVGWFSNRWLWVGVGAMALAQVAFVHLGVFNRLFRSEPLDAASWSAVLLVALAIGLIVGIEKALRRIVGAAPDRRGRGG
jgi:magnesium-transporting ATPase (P-type)